MQYLTWETDIQEILSSLDEGTGIWVLTVQENRSFMQETDSKAVKGIEDTKLTE